MRRFLMFGVVLAQFVAPSAWADFVVTTSPQTAVAEVPAPSAPVASVDTSPAAPSPSKPAPPTAPRFAVAEGFGDHVPLRFAVRQIVPSAVKVTYGPGANADADVDWHGGEGWNRVLSNAVRPLGLRLVMTYMAVEIRR
jgi:hypothetical protein